jgi:hypothetical protein
MEKSIDEFSVRPIPKLLKFFSGTQKFKQNSFVSITVTKCILGTTSHADLRIYVWVPQYALVARCREKYVESVVITRNCTSRMGPRMIFLFQI